MLSEQEKKRENVGIFPHGRTAPLLYTWVLKVNDMEFWISDVALWSGCGGDEFECKYPAFTGISREIRCDLGEGDKARRGGELVAGGVFPLYSHFWKTFKIHGDSWCILYILLQNIVLI